MFDIPLKQEKRSILHIDADAFFASVEQAMNPELKGKPILVGGNSDKYGIVSTASYEAKNLGIYSGMAIYQAKKICPEAIVVPGHFEVYREFSRKMYEIFSEYTPDVEMASIDEAYLDITGCLDFLKKSAEEVAREILFRIHESLDITASCGVSSCRTVSKIASGINKPHKLTVVPHGKEKAFLSSLSLKAMPGVGPKTFKALNAFGLEYLGDLSVLSLDEVIDKFGLGMVPLWKRSKGVDNRGVSSESSLPKSISNERTFYKQPIDLDFYMHELKALAGKVFYRLRGHDMRTKTVSLKVKYKFNSDGKHYFKYFSFQRAIPVASALDSELFPIVKDLFIDNYIEDSPIRLIGVGVSNLRKNYNLNLFGDNAKEENLFEAVDKMRDKHGRNKLHYGV